MEFVEKEYYDNGTKVLKSVIRKNESNQRHGICEWYHPEGQLWRKIEYQNGLRHGRMDSWRKNRTLEMKVEYENGYLVEEHFYKDKKKVKLTN